jgi:hypothetical protein
VSEGGTSCGPDRDYKSLPQTTKYKKCDERRFILEKDIELYPTNYKKAMLKISDGTLIRGKINVGELNRLSDLIRMTDEKFIVLVGTLHDESEEKTFIINKNNIIWIETGL